MDKLALLTGAAVVSAVAAGAGAGAGTISAARGGTAGAPGISRALSRIGHAFGGGMLTGVAVIAGASALIGVAVFEGIRQLGG